MRSVAVTGETTTTTTARRSVGTRGGGESLPRTGRTTGRSASVRSSEPGSAGEAFRQASPRGGRTAGRGFSTWNKKVSTRSRDFSTFQVPADSPKVIAFLEPDNYDMVFRHWVPQTNDEGRTFKVPRNCIEDAENDVKCPLCDVGDEPKPVALFNIADLDEPGKVQLWEAGKEVMKRIEELYGELQEVPEDRGGPLELNTPGVYAVVSRKKKSNGYWEYKIGRVKARDLDEDYGLEELSEELIEELMTKLNKSEDIKFNTVEELRELAANLED